MTIAVILLCRRADYWFFSWSQYLPRDGIDEVRPGQEEDCCVLVLRFVRLSSHRSISLMTHVPVLQASTLCLSRNTLSVM